MKYFIIFLLLPILAYTQNPKGVSPIANSPSNSTGQTYAVVIGISDYQDKDIPDLRFADKDAEAFANFLRSPAGGALDGDHLKVLTNQNATAGRIAEALDGLIEQAKEGDQVIIYFSGHGDVEGKKISQPGFLLAWDAPSRVYMGGGTYSLSFLQEVVTTLTVQGKAKVSVITDACHAGKLAGSQIGGSQLTTANLAKQYANEVKILSCQPNEFSLEGPQWGGGRGVFSYHLVDGLFGLADRNNDGQITLGEMDRYLEDKVTGEAAPQSQVPILLGNKTDRIATVNTNILADLKKNKTGNMQVFAATESRGFEDEILAKVDTSIQMLYAAFKLAVAQKRFLSPANDCAENYYNQLEKIERIAPLLGIMKRNYAAALQDDAQQVMNKWLKTDISEIYLSKTKKTSKYQSYPGYLERAANLLGSKHYMYTALMARMHFFNGYLLALSNRNPDKQLGTKALSEFSLALKLQPDLPHAYWQMSNVYGFNFLQPDSAETYARRAIELQPGWIYPNTNIAFLFTEKYKQFDRAKPYLEKANDIDSNSVMVLNNWGIYYSNQKRYVEAEKYFKRIIDKDTTFHAAFSNLGICYRSKNLFALSEINFKRAILLDQTNEMYYSNLGALYHQMGRFQEAEELFKKALTIDSTFIDIHFSLGNVSRDMGRVGDAEYHFKKAIQIDSTYHKAWTNLGILYIGTRRYAEAEQAYKKAIVLDSTDIYAWINLGDLYANTNRFAESEAAYQKAIQLDSASANAWNNLGNLYANTNRFAESEAAYQKAIQLDSASANAWNNLGNLYATTNRFTESEAACQKAIQLDSTFANTWNNLGNLYANTNRFAESEAAYQKAVQLDSTFANAWANLAISLSRKKQIEQAFAALEQALKNGFNYLQEIQQDSGFAPLREQKERWNILMRNTLVPDTSDAKAWLDFGALYVRTQRFDDAEPILKKALALDATLAPAHYQLGRTYFKTNRPEDARREFQKTIELSPQARMARLGMAWLLLAEGKTSDALDWVAQAIEKGGAPFDVLQSDEDLAPLRAQTERWKALMKKHFPNQFKD